MEAAKVWEEQRQAQLINIINKKGQLTVTSKEVAINFEKRHDHVIRDIENLVADMGSPQNWGHLFIESEYQHPQNKQWYKEYEITRDGFSLLVMGFTGKKALEWKLKYIEAFNRMEQQIKNNMPKISKELQAIFMIDERTVQLDSRVQKLENLMTIDYSQQRELNSLAGSVVIKVLGGKDTPAYKELNKKAFSQIWRDYKRVMQVNSYRNTAVKDFERARNFILNWKASRELELMIAGANSQMSFS